MNETRERGLALLCDAGGMILQVLRNDLELAEAIPGRLFLRLVDGASRSKALDLLTGIKGQGAIVDCELNVPVAGGPTSLHFSGGQVGEQLVIVGSATGKLTAWLLADFIRMNNEQTNRLRAALKDNVGAARAEMASGLYDEISRLNNDLVAMQRELAKKNAELERLNQEKNRFLGMAAHDLRNPLYAILSHSEFLREEDPVALGPKYREFLEVIHASSEFMGRLVDDLLDVAKIEAGHLQLDLTAADVAAVVARNVTLNRALAAKKSITIDLFSAPLSLALVDTAKLEQVLNNLIGNAIKFSPPGSRIEVRLTAAGTDFSLLVRDQGPGISPEEQARLFLPFQRGRKGSAGEKSTGLGLAIVKRIVEGHGGRIWSESAAGRGTVFSVSIPFQPPEVAI